MLYLIAATLVAVLLLCGAVALSLVDLERYNFALYVALLDGVTLVALLALWAAKPKCLWLRPRWFVRLCERHHDRCERKYAGNAEQDALLDPTAAADVMRKVRGIPYLIQAIQYSMESTIYSALMSQPTSTGAPITLSTRLTDMSRRGPTASQCETSWWEAESHFANEQLNLEVARRRSHLLVFPLSGCAAPVPLAAAALPQHHRANSVDSAAPERKRGCVDAPWYAESQQPSTDESDGNCCASVPDGGCRAPLRRTSSLGTLCQPEKKMLGAARADRRASFEVRWCDVGYALAELKRAKQ